MTKEIVIVGNSKPLDSSFLEEKKNSFLVACDGGYEVFIERGVLPDLVVADFDTFDKNRIPSSVTIERLNPIKDETDVFHAVRTNEDKFDLFSFYGCLGGERLEHEIANLQVLLYLRRRNKKAYMYTNDLRRTAFVLKDETLTTKGKKFFSLFALNDNTCISIKNAKYEVTDKLFSSDFPLGVSNEFLPGEEARIEVKGEALLIMDI